MSSAAENFLSSLQERYENKIAQIIHRYDANAFVLVNFDVEKVNDAELPMTNLIVKEITLQNEGLQPKISAVHIAIFSKHVDFPAETTDLVKSVVKATSENVNLEFKSNLPGAAESEVLPLVFANTGHLSIAERLTVVTIWTVASLLLMLGVLGIVGIILTRKQMLVAKEGITRLSSALADRSPADGSKGNIEARKAQGTSKAQNANLPSQNLISALNNTGLIALLADCYWTHNDAYAGFIWRRIAISQRANLIDQYVFLNEFSKYILDINEVDLGQDQHPYYLNPLPIHHLNSEKLTECVKQQPQLLQLLPPMRAEALSLSARERIEINTLTEKTPTRPVINLEKMAPSPLRTFKHLNKIQIRSNADEREVLALPNLSMEVKADIPSLGWALELRKTQVESIFNDFNARDLASAWVGPEEVLEKLAFAIAPKKWELVQNYLKKSPGDRNSPAFRRLHAAIMAVLENSSSEEPSNQENKTPPKAA